MSGFILSIVQVIVFILKLKAVLVCSWWLVFIPVYMYLVILLFRWASGSTYSSSNYGSSGSSSTDDFLDSFTSSNSSSWDD